MIKLLLIFSLLLAANCSSYSFEYKYNPQDTTYDDVSFYNLKTDTVFYRKPGQSMPVMEFYAIRKADAFWDPIQSLTVKDSATGKVILVIDSEKDSVFVFNINFDDYNFDGYKDMYLYDLCALYGNCSGRVFIFDPAKKVYVHDRAFDEMTSVSIDNEKKEINSWRQFEMGIESESAVYKYIEGKLMIQKEIIVEYEKEKSLYIYTVKVYDTHGKLKKKKVIKSENPDLEF
jgi:hypothetical protein